MADELTSTESAHDGLLGILVRGPQRPLRQDRDALANHAADRLGGVRGQPQLG